MGSKHASECVCVCVCVCVGGWGGRDSMLTLYSEQGQITGLSNTVCATFDHLCMFIKQFHLAL